jgi:hypothetical protein
MNCMLLFHNWQHLLLFTSFQRRNICVNVVKYLHIISQAKSVGINSLFAINREMRVTMSFMFYCECFQWVITCGSFCDNTSENLQFSYRQITHLDQLAKYKTGVGIIVLFLASLCSAISSYESKVKVTP